MSFDKEVTEIMIAELKKEEEVITSYILSSIKSRNWKAVADGAIDLRELDVKLSILQSLH